MARRTLTTAVLVLGISALASARDLYRVEVRGARPLLAQDQPIVHGTVVVFHRHPDGRLTGLPREMVGTIEPAGRLVAATPRAIGTGARIRLSSARVRASLPDQVVVSPDASIPPRPLEPGDALLLGPTGSGSTSDAAHPDPTAPANGGPNGMNGANGAYGYGTGAGSPLLNPTMTGSANVANNGATATGPSGAQQGSTQPFTPINPNGFPATTTNGPQSGANPIGPNGFPATTTNGPQSGTNPIGPNGFPVPTTSSPRGKQ